MWWHGLGTTTTIADTVSFEWLNGVSLASNFLRRCVCGGIPDDIFTTKCHTQNLGQIHISIENYRVVVKRGTLWVMDAAGVILEGQGLGHYLLLWLPTFSCLTRIPIIFPSFLYITFKNRVNPWSWPGATWWLCLYSMTSIAGVHGLNCSPGHLFWLGLWFCCGLGGAPCLSLRTWKSPWESAWWVVWKKISASSVP